MATTIDISSSENLLDDKCQIKAVLLRQCG